MIYGNTGQLMTYEFLDSQIQECFEYAKTHDITTFEKGCHAIDGERLFVNVVEYTTTTAEERFWEAHKNYLDVHVMLRGAEQIDVNFIENMELKEFVEKDDFLPMEGEKSGSVILKSGDFLICYPPDAHRTAVAVQAPEAVKKAIFKVRIDRK
ncbi:YhcH/YjgK/YiaL family protein [Hespellia stercorisuis]|uniref:YhcH/YjgK/YiaL family protein n=1 Tax=Hespellia stercorisuis DSM 15480 TaxID=1121950 RepID=A0A1M6K9N9_9FIRM|nr:YhcH/YjgK/YiaL family protein [Hespellia stercorisuis]SHJ55643.1 YhcH/YjgK/YiaL family protein [Hespellia stercorisuis DSM 15480]